MTKKLPRAMLIDMDDTILSAYGRPEIAWNNVATEFAGEFGSASSEQVAAAIVESGRKFWATAAAEWRLKLEEARHVVVQDEPVSLPEARDPGPDGGDRSGDLVAEHPGRGNVPLLDLLDVGRTDPADVDP